MPEYTTADYLGDRTPYRKVRAEQVPDLEGGEQVMKVVKCAGGNIYWIGVPEAEKPSLVTLKRSQLNAIAIRLGIEEPKKNYKNAELLIAAIEAEATAQGIDPITLIE